MYILLKGKLNNFMFSLEDYITKKSNIIKRFPQDVLLWGGSRTYSLYEKGANVFLYLSREVDFQGGVVLYGELLTPQQLKEKYWPEGEWPILLPIKIKKLAQGVVENPKDPEKWKIITLDKLKELGIRPLPGIQKIEDETGGKIVKLP